MASRFNPYFRPSATLLSVAAVLILLGDTASQAGIQGSGRKLSALARVSSFDEGVIVDGVRFDTSHARVRIDNRPGSVSELESGQLVEITGELGGAGHAVAADVSYVSDVQGFVTDVNQADDSFAVLGQRVRVVDTTLFDKDIHPDRLKGLRTGMSVAVSAFASVSGELIASRVQLADDALVAQARGVVEQLDSGAHTFLINDLTVEYAGALLEGSLSNGVVVTVRGIGSSSVGVLLATEVGVSAGMFDDTGVAGAIEGLITRFDSGTQFHVNGQRVATVATTRWELHGAALQVDQRVDVSGTFDAAGVLIADRVRIEPLMLDRVAGAVESIAVAERTLRVLGVDVSIGPETILEDRAHPPVHDFQLSDLQAGDLVEIHGSRRANDTFAAAVLQRENAPQGPKAKKAERKAPPPPPKHKP